MRDAVAELRGAVPVVLHAWSGSAEATRALLRLPNVHFSLGGHLGGVPPHKALPMVRCIPLDRLLLESDAPDGALQLGDDWVGALPVLGVLLRERAQRFLAEHAGGNAPAAVALTLTLVAVARGEGEAQVAAATAANARRVFGGAAAREGVT